MPAAESIDPSLRAAIRRARADAVRCFKVMILDRQVQPASDAAGGRTESILVLKATMPAAKIAALDKEFANCMSQFAKEDEAALMLFRLDKDENIDGSRWILLAWIPTKAAEDAKASIVRSRGLLSRVVWQPYFLHEHFAANKADLAWAVVNKSMLPQDKAVIDQGRGRASEVVSSSCVPEAELSLKMVQPLLQKFAQGQESAIRLQACVGPSGSLSLDGKSLDCRGAVGLSKCALPSSLAYLATMHKDELVFVLWMPDPPGGAKKDPAQRIDDIRHAFWKASVLEAIIAPFPARPPRVIAFDARCSEDISDHISKVLDAASAPFQPRCRASDSADWPAPGKAADFPVEWPAAAVPAAEVPTTLLLHHRLLPPWRGGTKAHTMPPVDVQAESRRMRQGRSPI